MKAMTNLLGNSRGGGGRDDGHPPDWRAYVAERKWKGETEEDDPQEDGRKKRRRRCGHRSFLGSQVRSLGLYLCKPRRRGGGRERGVFNQLRAYYAKIGG